MKGVRLQSDHFKADYYNTSSKAFKDMAKEKEYLLWVLVKTTGQDKAIQGNTLFIQTFKFCLKVPQI